MDLDQVPMRAEGMTPYEILLSESQERMLLVIHEGREAEVFRIFEKWDLTAARIGEVTDDGIWRCCWHGTEVAAIPVDVLTEAAPKYDRPQARPEWQDAVQRIPEIPEESNPTAALLQMMASEDLCDKHWIWRQYDHSVGTDTVVKPGADAAVVRIKGTNKALAFAADCNGRHVYLDPHVGTAGQVAEAARNLACVGAVPVGLTDCLNFGNPERPEIMWQFARSVDGMAEACRAFDIPVVSGNVSLYNETDGQAILPTPGIAVVGLIEGDVPAVESIFTGEGLEVAVLGGAGTWMGGSTYLSVVHGLDRGSPPPVDYDAERALHDRVRRLVCNGVAVVAHDISDGGLAVALAEMVASGVGGRFRLPGDGDITPRLFGEDHGRFVVAYAPEHRDVVGGTVIGTTGGDRLTIGPIDAAVADIISAWSKTFERWANL
jgi:phosphoribosylformylglycinamidine synthase